MRPIKNINKIPHAYASLPHRMGCHTNGGEELVVVLIPQTCFSQMLELTDEDVSRIVKHMIKYVSADGAYPVTPEFDTSAATSCYHEVLSLMQRYMVKYKTAKKRKFVNDKRRVTNKILAEQNIIDPADMPTFKLD